MLKIVSIIGARPNIIKMAPVHRKLIENSDHIIIHTGQHYDYKMSEIFFKEFNLPSPTFNLDVGSGTPNYQVGEMMMRIEKVLLSVKPDLVLVYGDTNSTLAGALSTRKCNLPLAHVEAGLRSFDRRMPEEINRVIVDSIADYLFAPTETSVKNLSAENAYGQILYTGDISVEIVKGALKLESKVLSKIDIGRTPYILLTLHRAENTNTPDVLRSIVDSILMIDDIRIIFPIHPRTRVILQKMNLYEDLLKSKNLLLIPPLGYVDFINLVRYAKKVVTDSGGLQKEAYLLGTPCITLRENTEWVETVSAGWNILVGTETKSIVHSIRKWFPNNSRRNEIFGNGTTSSEIVNLLTQIITKKSR